MLLPSQNVVLKHYYSEKKKLMNTIILEWKEYLGPPLIFFIVLLIEGYSIFIFSFFHLHRLYTRVFQKEKKK